jgi:hypothetical protein
VLRTGIYALSFEHGSLVVTPDDAIAADAAVALPRLTGVPIEGLPRDADGFLPTEPSGRVRGVDDVFAAGDAVAFPDSMAAAETLWWPPGKIVGRYLAPFLAARAETILSPARGVGS